jgi:DNA-binding protein HU-beta
MATGREPGVQEFLPHFTETQRNEQDSRMNKTELTETVAGATGLSQSDASNAVDAVFDTIIQVLARGDQVAIAGFGSFVVKARAARAGRNPQTGETIQIKAANAPTFKAGKAFKDAVN